METGILRLRRIFALLSSLAMLITVIGAGEQKPGYTQPLKTVDFPLAEELVRAQGITTDGEYYYFSSNYGLLKTELDALTAVAQNAVAIPAELMALGVKHLGGITYANGKIYAGAEDSKVFENLYICVFDSKTLKCIEYRQVSGSVQENGIPWVAADSENGILYSARRDYPEVLNMYDLDTLEFIGTAPIDFPAHKVQGGEVYGGVLYLSVSRDDQAVYAVRLSDGHVKKALSRNLPGDSEGEGMTVLPTEDGGFFHVLDIASVRIAGHLCIYSFNPDTLFDTP